MKSEQNVARRLAAMAQARPDATAVVEPLDYDADGRRRYRHFTFRELDRDSDRIARGLREMGASPGTRLAMLVRPGVDFVSLAFGLFKAGVVAIVWQNDYVGNDVEVVDVTQELVKLFDPSEQTLRITNSEEFKKNAPLDLEFIEKHQNEM